MDELRFWSIARSAAEIQANMDLELVGNESGLVAYYKFNEGSGTSIADATGNGYTATASNGQAANWTTRSSTSCSFEMTNTPTVSITSPIDLSLSATTSSLICEGATDITSITSETGVNYSLRDAYIASIWTHFLI